MRRTNEKIWDEEAWKGYLYWQAHDKKLLQRINTLLKDIERHPFDGIGKPELLKGNRHGYWSRRIDGEHRLVYRVKDGKLEIASCLNHYGL